MILKRIVVGITLLVNGAVLYGEDYSGVIPVMPAKSNVSSSNLDVSKLRGLLRSGNSFQSRASNGALPVSVSVRQSDLSLQFSELVGSITSSAYSNNKFELKVSNEVSYNTANDIFRTLSFNIPYIQKVDYNDVSHPGLVYYNLVTGNSKQLMMVKWRKRRVCI